MTWWLSRDKLKNSFWNAISWIWDSWIESAETIAPAMYSLMVFNSWTTVWDIRTMTESFKSDNALRDKFYQESIIKLNKQWWTKCAEHFRSIFSNKFDEQKWNSWLASIWIMDNTSNYSNNKKLVYELANNASMNEIIIEKFRTERWVKETSNSIKKKEFREYVSNLKKKNQALDIAVLESHPEWFELDKDATYTERPEDNQFKESLVNQINWLSIDELKKSELKTAMKRFYDERTIDSKPLISDFSLRFDNGLLILKSHNWQETQIKIDTNEIVGFWKGTVRFADLSELLNVADITNKILESQKWKIATGNPPFQYKSYVPSITNWIGLWWRWIYFNDETFLSSINFDTRVLSWGRGWVMWKIDTIWQHPNEYAEYLSSRRIEMNKPTS